MPVSPSDLLEPPFRFGECEESDAHGKVFCNAWADGYEIDIRIRREGKRTTIYIPELLADCVEGTTTADCDVKIYLKEGLVEDNDFVIDNTATIQYVGSMQIYDDKAGFEVPSSALVTYKPENATFRFEPITNFTVGAITTPCARPVQVGILATEIEIIDEGENAVIEVEEDIDMDYEEVRDDYANTEETFTFDAACASWKTAHQNVSIKFSKFGNIGKISLPQIISESKQSTSYGKNELYINITKDDMLNFFNGYLPTGELTGLDENGNRKKCWVRTYCTNTIDDNRYFRWVEGLIYYSGTYLKVVPNTEYYKFFNCVIVTSYASTTKIGLIEPIEIEFEIQKDCPEYENMRSETPEFNLYKVKNTVDATFTCGAWENESMGNKSLFLFKYFNDNIPRIRLYDTFASAYKSGDTITQSTIKIPLSQKEVFETFGGYMPSGYLHTNAPIRALNAEAGTTIERTAIVFYYDGYLHVAPNFGTSNTILFKSTNVDNSTTIGFYSFDILPELVDTEPTSYEALRTIQ